MARQILHVDMDAFYASVEQRDDPALRGKPVLVGGHSRRGVVTAASYEARPFGVRSAMSMVEALRRCPHAIVVPGRHRRYAEVSSQIFGIFHRVTPLVEGLSLDEAFLDVTASQALFGDGAAIARMLKQLVFEETGLRASAGVAPCKFAAKIASDLEKPDGLVVVHDVAAFLEPLPIERMWGVGPRAAERLRSAGLETIGDLARASAHRLEVVLGPAWGAHVHELARGIDERPVVPGREALSIGAEETFDEDLTTRSALEVRILGQASRVAQRLLRAALYCSAVVLKVKYADFTVKSRRMSLPEPIGDTDSIYRAARSLLDRLPLEGRRVRLTGVSAGSLVARPAPLLFPDQEAAKRRRLEEVVARASERFGDGRLTRAALLGSPPRR